MKNKDQTFIRDLTIDDEYDIIKSSASVKDAALKMKEAGIPDLVVVDDKDNVLGVIADFDIVTGLIAEGLSAETAKVTEIMYTIEPVTPDTPVETAFSRMRDLDVSVIPVIENKKLTGVATITDCWGMLPEKYEDKKGFISVTNPRLANYGFTVLMIALYFCFSILAPAIGIVGFLKAPIAGSAIYSGTYYLFEARGAGFWLRYLDFKGTYSGLWFILTIYSFIFLILGIFSALAIFQWAYADYNHIKTKRNYQILGLAAGIINVIIIWGLFLVFMFAGALRVPESQISIDISGLFLSLLGIVFLIVGVSRDFLFRENTPKLIKED